MIYYEPVTLVYNPKTDTTEIFSREDEVEIVESIREVHFDLDYHSIFLLDRIGKIFSTVTLEEKNRLSHRVVGVKKAKTYLKTLGKL